MTTGTVTGTFSPASAGIPLLFTPAVPRVIDPVGNITTELYPVNVATNVSGAFSVTLQATDDSSVTPTNWTWRLTGTTPDGDRLDVSFRLAGGTTLDLADIVPTEESPGNAIFSPSYMDVRWGGVVGDGITADGVALNTFLSDNAGKVILIPAGLIVRTTVPIVVPSGTTIVGYGATLKNACPGTSDVLVDLSSADNVTIEGLTLDGAKASFAGATEQRHGLYLSNSSNITLINVTSHDNKGDGLYIGHSTNGMSSIVRDYGGVYRNNHRNNCSIVHAQDVKFYGTAFNDASGTSPETGVDIEPNEDDDVIDDIQFFGCSAIGNAGRGFWYIGRTSPTVRQGNVGFWGCTADSNTHDGFRINSGIDIRIEGGGARLNGETGVYIINAGRNIRVVTTSSENGNYGLLHATGVIDGLIVGGTYWHNGSAASNTYDGILLASVAGTTEATVLPGVIAGGPSSGARQRYGLRVQTNYNLKSYGGWFPNNVTAATLIATASVDGFKNATDWQLGGALDLTGSAGAGFASFVEQSSDPSAPSANGARLFAKDNGAGKTQLVVRFSTGATQVIATEP